MATTAHERIVEKIGPMRRKQNGGDNFRTEDLAVTCIAIFSPFGEHVESIDHVLRDCSRAMAICLLRFGLKPTYNRWKCMGVSYGRSCKIVRELLGVRMARGPNNSA
ncbi:hypothetical protein Sjap_008235 [Stephania japonica]|uniref:Uncharacterized protein n=1 Tax=Stephania japonica TaxID=461633 RepID=A0AAP0JPX8_9MAGN